MLNRYLRKSAQVVVSLALIVLLVGDVVWAQSAIVYRSGKIKVTMPDGTVLVVGKKDPMPQIVSGVTIEIISGAIDVTGIDGFVQILAEGSLATVKPGGRLIASAKGKEKGVSFKVITDAVTVVSGNTATTIQAGQIARITYNKGDGTVQVKSIDGVISTTTGGVQALVPKNGVAKIKVDAKTRKVKISSVSGVIQVISSAGNIIKVDEDKATDIDGDDTLKDVPQEDEVDTGEIPLEDEPTEPEVPETSPYQP
ncbi:MAG: hypothetical protein ABII88_08440 [Candidatus Omnitrophota bacterium]